MEKFLTMLAWILVIPLSVFVGWTIYLLIVAFTTKGVKLTIGSIIPYIIFALSWAWILSR